MEQIVESEIPIISYNSWVESIFSESDLSDTSAISAPKRSISSLVATKEDEAATSSSSRRTKQQVDHDDRDDDTSTSLTSSPSLDTFIVHTFRQDLLS